MVQRLFPGIIHVLLDEDGLINLVASLQSAGTSFSRELRPSLTHDCGN
jgi:hypothetical protein